ncbi:PilZ domain-containing protein [Marinobacterium mangrovicola]|uniref:PilZ domain-containing protein n=1 Tax=Marinobacterium mangrovicola TaxID=1476959 RepID=A0A4R1GWZ3_9GAMM|nr:PilZ domain-containing protein [Marinobacterium mangrovicola]TCK08952.1 PilZ domain-containing protein [Marinobacterium mangrovicola]
MDADRRLYPRVFTDLSAQANKGSDNFPVQVVNLSMTGFQVEGGGQLAALTAEAGKPSVELSLNFQLAGQAVNSLCRVVYKRRMSVDRAALGLKIISIDDEARSAIESYVHAKLG